MDLLCLTFGGREFHMDGPETEKARSPYLEALAGTSRRSWFEDRKFLAQRRRWMQSVRYLGDVPARALKTSRATLYLIRWATGSQWSYFSKGETWSRRGFWKMSFAALFCNFWRRLTLSLVIPFSRALQ